ncbi:Pvc16 family protein [Anabaena azotica]|uniref:DUF4255 domain-containing protein n=1 Tax=Anabaena azotica FACHB-119 TaxID=947527 RepID=A0ABR8DC66_9NOST|nr:Pvc16 family protein [Anabaena azotica]MBD2503812.1 DUF4255 domain-containing protein [Anabaena azotica FACHB-119]
MIRDLSQTLEAILTQSGLPPELAAARIIFDRPVDKSIPQQPTINLFLYDIRENLELRSNEPNIERNNGQAVIVRPPLRMDCTYLITAWPTGGTELALQEHRLLSQVLRVLSRYHSIPEQFLQGSFSQTKPILPLTISSIDRLKNPSEFWTALGIQLRAALAATITISIEPLPENPITIKTYKLVRETGLRLEQDRFAIEGEVEDINYQPVASATVQLVELAQTATTQSDGYYSFRFIPAGVYTLRVQPPSGTVQNFPITVPPLGTGKYKIRLT